MALSSVLLSSVLLSSVAPSSVALLWGSGPARGQAPPPLLGEGAAVPEVAPLSPFAPPAAELRTLPCGATVWLRPDDSVPLVRITVSLQRGVLHAGLEPGAVDALPLVHAGALLDEGPLGWTQQAWEEALDRAGARLELSVGMARAWASVEVPAGQEEQGLDLLFAALQRPAFPRRAFRDNRAQAARDAERIDAVPGTLHAMAVQRALYPAEHPLGRVWTAGEHRRVRLRQVRRAWAEELALGPPAVVAVGAVQPDRLLPLLEERLAGFAAVGEAPDRLALLAPAAPGPRTLLVDLPGLERVFVSVLLGTPGAFSPDEAALEVLHRALSAEFDSRLSTLLRVERGWTYGVHGLLRVWPGHGVMEIRFAVDPSVLDQAIPAVQAELAAVASRPPSGEELDRARAAVRRDAALRQLRLARQAHHLSVMQAWGEGPAHEAALLAAVQAVDSEDVAAVARAIVDPATAVWVFTGDRDLVEPALEAAGLPLDSIRTPPSVVDGEPPVPL